MLHLWKSVKTYAQRMGVLDLGLLKICCLALGTLMGLTVSRKKKLQTGVLAGGVFAATCLPLMNKFLDVIEETAAEEQ
ncbi:MAG: hypothetical protein ACI3U1_06650 [Peptococcaceae bacterium]